MFCGGDFPITNVCSPRSLEFCSRSTHSPQSGAERVVPPPPSITRWNGRRAWLPKPRSDRYRIAARRWRAPRFKTVAAHFISNSGNLATFAAMRRAPSSVSVLRSRNAPAAPFKAAPTAGTGLRSCRPSESVVGHRRRRGVPWCGSRPDLVNPTAAVGCLAARGNKVQYASSKTTHARWACA